MKHQVLLQAIPNVRDVQSAWLLLLLLLLHCATVSISICALSNRNWWFSLPEPTMPVCGSACARSWGVTLCDEMAKATATLPLILGGMGLRSAERSRVAAQWASWADTLPMNQERHPAVAELIVGSPTGAPESPCLGSPCGISRVGWCGVCRARMDFVGRMGCAPNQENQNISSRVRRGLDGNMRLLVVWNATMVLRTFCLTSAPHDGPCCDPRAVQLQEFLSRRLLILFDSVGTCSLPGPSPTPLCPPFVLDQALLPVWPSSRRLWPPPCNLFAVRSAGEEGFLIGNRSCKSVQRGRGRVATNLFVRDMDWESRMPRTTHVWRWWPTVCHFLVACSLL